jgi:2-keto-4-pentenoate hydratase/2-oxohepta-3-ene-1,7-dioic acid hydratase in catechol pathway
MKIIAVGMNYADHNKEMHHTLVLSEPVIFMKPDSALLKNGKPFFIPNFSSDIQYETEVVVKINKLGKNIDEQFAYRYYDEVTVGIDVTARDLQGELRRNKLPWELCKGFDGSAIIGTFVPLAETGAIQNLDFHLDIDGRTVQKGNTSDMICSIDRVIAYVSRFVTLKTGDLIFSGTPAGVGRIEIGNHLQGYLGERKLLDFYAR